jgi:phospholipid-transporting ATPase
MLVDLCKKYKHDAITLAIGDGANDVAMINSAHVGVGIIGKEGKEAANASDFSISEFKFLSRLIFYHGNECYRKNCYLVLFTFYKNILVNMPIFFYGIFNGFSCFCIFDEVLSMGYNAVFTALPIVVYVLCDEIIMGESTLNCKV